MLMNAPQFIFYSHPPPPTLHLFISLLLLLLPFSTPLQCSISYQPYHQLVFFFKFKTWKLPFIITEIKRSLLFIFWVWSSQNKGCLFTTVCIIHVLRFWSNSAGDYLKLKTLVLMYSSFFSTHMCIAREYKCFNSIKSNNEIPSCVWYHQSWEKSYFLRNYEEIQYPQFPPRTSEGTWFTVHVSEQPKLLEDWHGTSVTSTPSPGKLRAAPHRRVWICPGWTRHLHCPARGIQRVWYSPNSSEASYRATGERQSLLHRISEQELHCCELLPGAAHLSLPTTQTTDGI